MNYTAVIFDLDGTLLDTESQMVTAGQRAFAGLGLDVPDGFFERLVGVDFNSGKALIAREWPDLDFDRVNTLWASESRAMLQAGIPLKSGALELVDHVDRLGLPKAIATSSFGKSAGRKLAASDLDGRFDTIVSVDDVRRAKPAPDAYILAARHLQAQARHCLAFEDSETGAQSAFAAGMTVVQVRDVTATSGDYAHYQGRDLLHGANLAGLI